MYVATQPLSAFQASWVGNTAAQTRLCARPSHRPFTVSRRSAKYGVW
jgi:hypothetical protein